MLSTDFDNLKTALEKQIIIVLDFLLLDKQIKPLDVRHISQFVLINIDISTTSNELKSSLAKLISHFPVLADHLNSATKHLKQLNA